MALVLAFQGCADASVVPIFKLPLLSALTTKELTVPSTSASLPWARRSAKVISTAVSSLVFLTGAAKAVRVGTSLVPVILIVTCSVSMPPSPSFTETV